MRPDQRAGVGEVEIGGARRLGPATRQAEIIASQRIRQFLGEAMAHGESTSWAFQPVSDAAHRWVRSTDDDPWDPLCGF